MGNLMGAVFLLDIHVYLHRLRIQLTAEAKKFTSTSLRPALVGNMSKNESLDSDEIRSGGLGDS